MPIVLDATLLTMNHNFTERKHQSAAKPRGSHQEAASKMNEKLRGMESSHMIVRNQPRRAT